MKCGEIKRMLEKMFPDLMSSGKLTAFRPREGLSGRRQSNSSKRW